MKKPDLRNGRPILLHLSNDYNDPHRIPTTTAVEWFVAETAQEFDTVVVSMTRKSDPRQTYLRDCGIINGSRVFAFGYHGLPFGVALFPSMWLAARRIHKQLEKEGIKPDLIHAHKFCFEGLAGWVLSRWYDIPLFLSLRGEAETKIFRRKPEYRPLLRRIARDAEHIYHVSAWFRDEYHKYATASQHESLLPNIVRNIRPEITTEPAGQRFVSIMHLDVWRKKGLHTLLDGLAIALRERPEIGLDIVGRGTEETMTTVADLAKKAGVENNVRFLGRLDNGTLLERLPTYQGLLLPSSNETFGMVYVEALFAGIPVLHTQGTGIDGYLDNLDVSIAVPEGDSAAVGAAILRMYEESAAYRHRLAASAPELFQRFDKEQMLARYRADVAEALRET